MATSSSDDFSVLVSASDLGIDATPFLANKERGQNKDIPEPENWHDCSQYFVRDEDFSDLDLNRAMKCFLNISRSPFVNIQNNLKSANPRRYYNFKSLD